jgi:pyruvate dehydrogenase E2 component (dihydrolipoamide acetyltransferase)
MIQIAAEVSEIAKKTRDGKIKPGELEGGSFTITNLGGIAGTHFTPIVNYPEAAILGMGRSYTEAGFIDNEWKPQIVLPLSLTYDHRLIDGADGARFIKWVIEAIEEPLILSLEG